METKKAPCSGGDRKQGNPEYSPTVSPLSQNVKSENKIISYLSETFTRFKLQAIAKKLIRSRLDGFENKNYCKCHSTTRSALVSLRRNPETFRAYYDGVITCATSMLCPVCSPRIMGTRSAEIRTAVHSWLAGASENTCYLITLTVRHCLTDSLVKLLSLFKKAREAFWRHGTLKRLLQDSGRVGRITATEIQYGINNGWHPHQHILLFCRKTDFQLDVLRSIWLAALASVGLSGVGDIAFDLIEARSCDSYLTKLSSEMVLGALKDGRLLGHYSPFQLLEEFASGSAWAGDRFLELFASARQIHPLVWSRGLKARFGIGEVSDQQITDNKADASSLVDFLWMQDKGFKILTPELRAALRNAAAVGDWDKACCLLDGAGVQFGTKKEMEVLL